MNTPITTLAALGMAIAFSLAATADEDKELSPKDVPQAVRDAFQKAHPGVSGVEYSTETLEGQAAYEVEYKDRGQEIEAIYSGDGVLLATEEEIKTSELPPVVVNAIKKEHPHATLKEAEKILRPDGALRGYEVEIAEGRKHLELELDPNGTILTTQQEKT